MSAKTISKAPCDSWTEAYDLKARLDAAGVKCWIVRRGYALYVNAVGTETEIARALAAAKSKTKSLKPQPDGDK